MAETLPVLVVEDDKNLREALTDTLELAGYSAIAAADAEQALSWLEKGNPGLVLSDVQMPGMDGHALLRMLKTRRPDIPVILMTAYGQIDRAVQAMRDGAVDYLPKPFEPDQLLATVARYFRQSGEAPASGLVAEDPTSRALQDLARRVAASEASVLLTGESGVGKEVFARYIHRHSARHKGPFVAVNCAAIPENLLESILFGHEKGAFTGATAAQPGKFEQANGGTLLLDEISELPLNLQAKLLRVLQEREVERVGGRNAIPLDARVIAATNRDLTAWVREGRFREDLYYRLNVFPLEIPPLRERPADIPALADKHDLNVTVGTWIDTRLGRNQQEIASAIKLAREHKNVVRVLIGPDGRAQEAHLQRSSGYERLDQVALETARDRWRYVPGTRGGTPEAMWFNVPINFVLE